MQSKSIRNGILTVEEGQSEVLEKHFLIFCLYDGMNFPHPGHFENEIIELLK